MTAVPQCQPTDAVVPIQAQAYRSDDPESDVECQAVARPILLHVLAPAKPAKIKDNDTNCTKDFSSGNFQGDPAGKCVVEVSCVFWGNKPYI